MNAIRVRQTCLFVAGLVVAAAVTPARADDEPACDGIAAEIAGGIAACLEPGAVFRDCEDCPELVVVPAGRFLMGTSDNDITEMVREHGTWFNTEKPQHEVEIAQPFAVGRFEVTWAEWDACAAAGACDAKEPEEAFAETGASKDGMAVSFITWEDAQAYVSWLSEHTGARYRVLSEAQWEYVARAGTETTYWWGDEESYDRANMGAKTDQCCEGRTLGADRWLGASPVGSFPANPFGLYDTAGNMLEWTQDCTNGSYARAPADGSAWERGDCYFRIHRGGSYLRPPIEHRSSWRKGAYKTFRFEDVGLRVARDL